MRGLASGLWATGFALGILPLLGCNEARDQEEPPVVFADVQPILEELAFEPFTIEDRGGNWCGCTADGEPRQCQVLSEGLAPPIVL